MTPRTILVVDDSPVVLDVVAALLSVQTGHRVITHDDVFGLVGVVVRLRPDLIVLDLEMPVMTGDRMVDVLRSALGAEMPPVLLHSDAPLRDLESRARLCRADGFARKGDSFILVMRVCQMLDSTRVGAR